jgi:DNA-binding transcriptional MocR family regulator
MSDSNKRQLVKLLARHDIPLIEDDTYGDLAFASDRPSVCKSFDEGGRVLLCSSFSKTLAPGARVGWCAPGRYLEQAKVLKFCNTIATTTPPQQAIAQYMASGGYVHQLRRTRKIYAERVALVTASVQRHFPPGTRASRPSGGHVLWVELPQGSDSIALFERAAAMKISFAPGPLFSTSGGYLNCMRLNCAFPCDARLEQAIRVLGQLAESATMTS